MHPGRARHLPRAPLPETGVTRIRWVVSSHSTTSEGVTLPVHRSYWLMRPTKILSLTLGIALYSESLQVATSPC